MFGVVAIIAIVIGVNIPVILCLILNEWHSTIIALNRSNINKSSKEAAMELFVILHFVLICLGLAYLVK